MMIIFIIIIISTMLYSVLSLHWCDFFFFRYYFFFLLITTTTIWRKHWWIQSLNWVDFFRVDSWLGEGRGGWVVRLVVGRMIFFGKGRGAGGQGLKACKSKVLLFFVSLRFFYCDSLFKEFHYFLFVLIDVDISDISNHPARRQ